MALNRLLDALAPDVRRDVRNVQRALAPRQSAPVVNTTFTKASPTNAPVQTNGVTKRVKLVRRKWVESDR